jgi:TatD DNase family protein
MNLFDSHAHLDDERFNEDREAIIQGLKARGVQYVMNAGASLNSSKRGLELAKQHDFIYASVGVHPHDAETMTEATIDELAQLSTHEKVKAIGEIGLDYYYDHSPRNIQQQWFERQIQLAIDLKMPIILHDRDAHGDMLDMLRKYKGHVTGVMHCYSGSVEMAKEILDLGYMIAFGGVITFKNGQRAQKAANIVPMDKLLIETDAPYLTPEPHRGKRNDPGYVLHVAEKLAESKGQSFEALATQTCGNAKQLFDIA